jgi:hypothetical protein
VGFLNFGTELTFGFDAKKLPVDKVQAKEILQTIKDVTLSKSADSGLSPVQWLNGFINAKLPNRPGIEKVLEGDESGNLFELLVGFEPLNKVKKSLNKVAKRLGQLD